MQNETPSFEPVSMPALNQPSASCADSADEGLADIGYEAAQPVLQSPLWQAAVAHGAWEHAL